MAGNSEIDNDRREKLNEIYEQKKCAKIDYELDIECAGFNPLRALYVADSEVIKSNIIYQNVAAFESAFKKFGIWRFNLRNKKIQANNDDKQSNTRIRNSTDNKFEPENTIGGYDRIIFKNRFSRHQMARQGTRKLKQRHERNIFKQISTSEGPQARLWQWLYQQLRVRVVFRKEHGIRGTIEGKLIIFDKHWNLVLSEVTETLTRRKHKFGDNKMFGNAKNCESQLQALGLLMPSPIVKILNRKTVILTRKLPRIMVRGEQLVLITAEKVK